jgi:hypothetical protein
MRDQRIRMQAENVKLMCEGLEQEWCTCIYIISGVMTGLQTTESAVWSRDGCRTVENLSVVIAGGCPRVLLLSLMTKIGSLHERVCYITRTACDSTKPSNS